MTTVLFIKLSSLLLEISQFKLSVGQILDLLFTMNNTVNTDQWPMNNPVLINVFIVNA